MELVGCGLDGLGVIGCGLCGLCVVEACLWLLGRFGCGLCVSAAEEKRTGGVRGASSYTVAISSSRSSSSANLVSLIACLSVWCSEVCKHAAALTAAAV